MIYDVVPQEGIEALSIMFGRELPRGQAISWDELVLTYRQMHRLASVLSIFLSFFLVPDRGQHGLEYGWGIMLHRMVEAPEIFGWGQCMLAHMFDEMHKIVYHGRKTMLVGVYVLNIWAWEHLPVYRPIHEDAQEVMEPYIYRYQGHITQVFLGKTKH